ncbi:hypothetical protein [Pseudorhodoferax sp. Leaf265]|uniref:hypothetical protein n=1 Tax=Pseudorhodoferax sp. Leaf265 TaxID=1736315 RepID=UPI0006FEADC6|nr:hypothetical protein [Pseudorhodoferax sp. Leaf265]KQP02483.1 hypothetical protein ASF45_20735 [Pseudorhodoferax sp. Leaf265]
MDNLKTRILGMKTEERDQLASSAGTTRGLLNQIAFGGKQIELGLADCFVALLPGLTLDGIPLTERARRQAKVRASAKRRRPAVAEAEQGV